MQPFVKRYVKKMSAVPRSRTARFWHVSNLAANIGVNVLVDKFKRNVIHTKDTSQKGIVGDNLKIIVQKFSKMRGAALKIAQLLCMHGTLGDRGNEVLALLEQSQNNAHSMNRAQLNSVLMESFGKNWMSKYKSFDINPFAAASIGQVHLAVTHSNQKVAVKVQYPGVDESIDSDTKNIIRILSMIDILPKGMFLENIMETTRLEYLDECDYNKELQSTNFFSEKIKNHSEFYVPKTFPELSSKRVITTEFIDGIHLSECHSQSQSVRNFISASLFKLCLLELFEFKTMQTDPNWSNFIYIPKENKVRIVQLI